MRTYPHQSSDWQKPGQVRWTKVSRSYTAVDGFKLIPPQSVRQIAREELTIGENLDEGIGLLMQKVDSLGIARNTYVIYMSDNGGGGRGGNPLRGGKGDVWEGGIRVPLIIRGPGIAAGSWSHRAVVGYDFYNTFAEWAGYDKALPKTIEGGSITHLLNGQDHGQGRRRLPSHDRNGVIESISVQADQGVQSTNWSA